MPWQPVVDGDVIPAPPIDRIIAGASADIDLMVGTNTDEWRLFLVPGGAIDHITDEALAGAMAAYGLPVEAALATYRAAHPGASAGDLLAAVQTDWYWRIPAIRLADAHATEQPRPPTCTSSPGARRSSTDASARAMRLRFPSSSTRWARGLSRCWEPTRRNSSPTPCTPPG